MQEDKSSTPPRLRVAIVGAGPAGLYAADALIKQLSTAVQIDMFDKLPAPYGLVRYGVAPDHEKIKSVTKIYQRILASPQVRFFGNITFGTDLTHDDLKAHYHQILYTVGTPRDRHLNIPNEAYAGSISATGFVAWYNGHPDYRDFAVNLSGTHAVIVGAGNVALDTARILARSVEELQTTDIADHALEKLAQSQIRQITVLVRRGPAQAKFSVAEVKELGHLQGVDLIIDPDELVLDPVSEEQVTNDKAAQRLLAQLQELSQLPIQNRHKTLRIRFLVSPQEVLGKNNQIESLRIEHNQLTETSSGYLNATGRGKTEELPADLLIRAIGYRGVALPGVAFDEQRGIIPNELGRIIEKHNGAIVPNEYVAGWVKRGPTGVIGTNKADAVETVAQMVEDHLATLDNRALNDIEALITARGIHYNSYEQWKHVEEWENRAGQEQGRPRVKMTTREELLGFCKINEYIYDAREESYESGASVSHSQ